MEKKSEKRVKGLSKVLDVFIAFSALFGIVVLLIVAYNGISYWTQAYKAVIDFQAQMFWMSLLLAIATGILNFLQIFIRQFASSYKNIFRKL